MEGIHIFHVSPWQEPDEDRDLSYDIDDSTRTVLDGSARDVEVTDVSSEDASLVAPCYSADTPKEAPRALRSTSTFVGTFSTIDVKRAPAKGGAYPKYVIWTGQEKDSSVEELCCFF